jgi:hypothetical protein
VKLRNLATSIVVEVHKLTEYALNPKHERGRHKAQVIETALGYTRDHCQPLIEQIERQALDAEAIVQKTDAYGQRVRVEIPITGVSGQQAIVVTGWLITPESDMARLVTLFVRKESDGQ